MSAFIWKEFIVSNLMLAGNHLSVLERDNAARVIGLLPVPWQQVEVSRVKGRNRYTIRFGDGREVIDQEDVLHVPGIGFDGIKGISPIQWAGRQAVGTAFALEEFVGRMHANSARPSGILEIPKGIKEEGLIRMMAEFAAMAAGLRNSGTVIPVDAGAKFTPMQLTLADAQTLESRRFQVADIARLFGVPPHMIGETDKTSSWGTGVEQQTIGFQIYNLEPELSRIEGEINRKLFKAPFYCEFNREALTAMDAKTLSELYASAVNNAGMTPNEIRRKRNLPDLLGGDDLYIQGATVPLRLAGQDKLESSTSPANDKSGELKARFDAYGVGVRAGAITPQVEDEEHFRTGAGLPVLSPDIAKVWKDEPTRRPITLVPTDGTLPQQTESSNDDL